LLMSKSGLISCMPVLKRKLCQFAAVYEKARENSRRQAHLEADVKKTSKPWQQTLPYACRRQDYAAL
jgi:hypothetical protein